MEKVVVKRKLGESTVREDLAYWLSRPVEERLEAVEILRRRYYGTLPRMERVVRVVRREGR